MEAWVWLTAYLVGFALLQLVLYRYFRRGDTEQPAGSPGDRRGARADAGRDARSERATEVRTDSRADARQSEDTDGVRCTHCGAINEQESTFTYCRECTQPIQ